VFGTARHFKPSFSYLKAKLGAYPHSRGQFYQNFWCQSRAALAQDIFNPFNGNDILAKSCQNMVLSSKAVSYTCQYNITRNVGET
jgi:hypothetical protein